ncbi:MAG: FaeA/PapI family transcriptional regulator [Candidatus Limnocylindrales bacterium]
MLPYSLARVNTVVMLHAAAPLATSDIAHAAALAYAPARSALATLEKRGIIRRSRRAGRDRYGPNRDSLHYPMAYLTALVDLPVADALRGERVSAVYAYGRIAQPNDSTRQSDLDLLIVGEIEDPGGLVARLVIMGSRLGRAVVPLILTDDQLDRANQRGDGQVAAALGGVQIFGDRPGGGRPEPT